jgi:hypothetical protein
MELVEGFPVPDFRTQWEQALPFEHFVAASAAEHQALWQGIYRLTPVPDWARTVLPGGQTRHLLVLAEDWCNDGSSTVPALARWADAVDGLDLRILRRDEHPELMDRYLTNGSRSIPIVIVLDEDYEEIGHWGPRPVPLQAWVMANKDTMPKPERTREIRRWYARDKGETAIREIVGVLGVGERVGRLGG